MLVFSVCTQHRSSCHEDYRDAYFQKIHSLCKHSLSLAQYIMCEKEEGNERRSLKIKFSVFALSFGIFYRLPGLRWKPIQSYRCFEFSKAMTLTSKILYAPSKTYFCGASGWWVGGADWSLGFCSSDFRDGSVIFTCLSGFRCTRFLI